MTYQLIPAHVITHVLTRTPVRTCHREELSVYVTVPVTRSVSLTEIPEHKSASVLSAILTHPESQAA